jgi:hypothetical protein
MAKRAFLLTEAFVTYQPSCQTFSILLPLLCLWPLETGGIRQATHSLGKIKIGVGTSFKKILYVV